MKLRLLKVFGHDLKPYEVKVAAEAAARTLEGKKYSLPVVDAVYGYGFEILLVDDELQEVQP